MGTAWAAEDLINNKLVVVKAPKLTGEIELDQINVEKLRVEIDIVKLLNHKNLVRFVDSIFLEGGKIPLLITEFAIGDVMEKTASGNPASERESIECMSALLDCVQYLHSLNIIHRDIRPKNIIIDKRNFRDPTLIDFGTAKLFFRQLDRAEGIVAPGGYSPPEHYQMSYSPQGDIWSLGGTLFFLLTGQHPLLALGDYPSNPSSPDPKLINPRISDRLANVVIKSMRFSPTQRYPSAEEMKLDLLNIKSKFRGGPVLIIRNEEIRVESNRVIIGRNDTLDALGGNYTTIGLGSLGSTEDKSPYVERSGDRMLVKIDDPGHFISRMHIELFRSEGKWFARDLGSLNGSAVMTDSGWVPLHRGYKQESPAFVLDGNAMIALGYNPTRGPYLVVTLMMN